MESESLTEITRKFWTNTAISSRQIMEPFGQYSTLEKTQHRQISLVVPSSAWGCNRLPALCGQKNCIQTLHPAIQCRTIYSSLNTDYINSLHDSRLDISHPEHLVSEVARHYCYTAWESHRLICHKLQIATVVVVCHSAGLCWGSTHDKPQIRLLCMAHYFFLRPTFLNILYQLFIHYIWNTIFLECFSSILQIK